jgi:ABC-type multidrug transport system fused ATPase/permease subunit
MGSLKKIFYLLSIQERKRGVLLLVMILIMATLDMIGVASIAPFMLVLTNPDIVETNIILKKMYQTSKMFGVENNQEFLFALGVLVFFLLVFSLTFKALTTYAQLRFTLMREFSISRRLIEIYIHQPYSWFLNQHSADLGKNILSEVTLAVGGSLASLLRVISASAVTILLVILLIIVDPKLALITGFLFAAVYGLIFKFLHRYLSRIGKERMEKNEVRFKMVSDAFTGIKEVKVGSLEQTYIKKFSEPSQIYARLNASWQTVEFFPRFALEAIGFGGIMLLILYLMRQTGSLANVLPIVSLYVFAGYRLMPAFQQIYTSFTSLAFIKPSLDKLYDDLKNLKKLNLNENQSVLSFNKSINLKNVYYNYPNASRTVLKNININIPAKNTVGFVGVTGSGKTTAIDMIIGLLQPQKGTLEIDGQVITEKNVKAWQRSIGYVSQQIYLSDDTIASNIAFGVNKKDINLDTVEKVSKIANLHDFIINELPQQYQTAIGERGVRLSGGQRQRIGIARALYHDPKVLILDEATNALDNQTEEAVMDAVNKLSNKITIILIAHRLNTVKNCDTIFLIDKGEIVQHGTFDTLFNNDKNFSPTIKKP